MIILDFLVFNLTNWYNNHRDRLVWSTPVGRASYIVGLITIMWMFSLWIIANIIFHKTITFGYGTLPFVVIGVAVMYLCQFVYEKKGRYEKIAGSENKPFRINDKAAQVLSIVFTFFSLFVTGLLVLFAP